MTDPLAIDAASGLPGGTPFPLDGGPRTAREVVMQGVIDRLRGQIEEQDRIRNEIVSSHASTISLLRETLFAARCELDRWGHGDMHYGNTPRDSKVLAMLAKIDEALDVTL